MYRHAIGFEVAKTLRNQQIFLKKAIKSDKITKNVTLFS